jgi:hypothetical protein
VSFHSLSLTSGSLSSFAGKNILSLPSCEIYTTNPRNQRHDISERVNGAEEREEDTEDEIVCLMTTDEERGVRLDEKTLSSFQKKDIVFR